MGSQAFDKVHSDRRAERAAAGGGVMTAQQEQVLEAEQTRTIDPALEMHAAGWPDGSDDPAWLVESLRYRFWDTADLARGIAHLGQFAPERQAAIAHWWSLLVAIEALGPPMYASMFARATEEHDDRQVRWSLLAMLRDELQHEQVCRVALRHLAAGEPGQAAWTDAARDADRHLRQVELEAARCRQAWRQGLDEHGTGVLSGAMLLRSMVLGDLCDQWAYGCPIPALATALRHLARDAQRHQCVLRALADRTSGSLRAAQRAEAAAQVRGTARLLSAVLLDPVVGPHAAIDDLGGRHCCEPGLGVPTAEQRLELMRAALLRVRDLHARHGIDFQAMPELAILTRLCAEPM
jgi:hypothetical protein